MAQTLTPGRWRGLKTTSTDDHVFTILAFDQRGTFRRMLPEGTPYDVAVQVKREVVVALAPHVSAVLLDPIYGLPAALSMSGRSGLLMALEKSGYSGDSTYRRVEFIEDWTVGKIKRLGASAVKLLVYYHPASGALAEELEALIQRVCQECHQHDIPLFVEPVSYSLDSNVPKDSATFAQTRPQVVRETAQRLSKLGMDVLKLEFPVDAAFEGDQNRWRAACEAVSEVCQVPWVLLSAGVDYDTFELQVRVACQAGAAGFLAGRAIWKEAIALSVDERQRFLAETAKERIDRLTAIVCQSARPWTEFYTFAEPAQDWYKSYPQAADSG